MPWRYWPKVLVFCVFLAVNIVSFSQGPFHFKSDSIACDTFPPPRNLNGVSYDNVVHIWWELPELSGGIVPDNLLAYKVYRNGSLLDSLLNIGDTTHYYDYISLSVYPTDHKYWVVAVYDLSECGLTGMYSESIPSDTLSFWTYYYFILSFLEDWSTGSFDPNHWSAGEFWYVDGQYGHPQPCAIYSNHQDTAYQQNLISYWIHCMAIMPPYSYIDGDIFLEYEIKLNHLPINGIDYLDVKIRDSLNWHLVERHSSEDGSFIWSLENRNITEIAKNKYIRIGFFANGLDGDNSFDWYIDNISVYRQCNPPRDLHWVIPDEVMAWTTPLPHTPTKEYKGKGLQGYNIYVSYGSNYQYHSFTSDTFHVVDTVGWTAYYVTSVYEDCEPASNEIFGPQVIEEFPLKGKISIYPNPANNSVSIETDHPIERLKLFNSQGEVYLDNSYNSKKTSLNTSSFPSGVYFIKINTGKQILTNKLIIQH